MIKTEERIAYFVKQGVKFFDHLPDGWFEIEQATTAPSGYRWIHTFKNEEYQRALCKNE